MICWAGAQLFRFGKPKEARRVHRPALLYGLLLVEGVAVAVVGRGHAPMRRDLGF